jgi:transposase-like protein
LLERFNHRKRAVTGKWHIDEAYIKVRGRWMYLYRAIDSNGGTLEFWFSERRNLATAKRFLSRVLKWHGRRRRIVIDGSQTNREAILSCDAASRFQDRSGASCRRSESGRVNISIAPSSRINAPSNAACARCSASSPLTVPA